MMKINRLFSLIGLLCFLSCGKTEYSDIPSSRVNLTLYLGDKDKELNAVLAHKIYTINDINIAQYEAVGFGGVLVYHGPSGFLAYDAACPYEMNPGTRVYVDSTSIIAVCPKCGSKYSLDPGGAPVSGPSTENPGRKRLRQYYNVMLSGNIIKITN